MDFSKYRKYYLTNYNSMNEYLKFLINETEGKKIAHIFFDSSIVRYANAENINNNIDKLYTTDGKYYIVFEDETCLIIEYLFYSLMYIEFTTTFNMYKCAKEKNIEELKLDMPVKGRMIIGYVLEQFADEYEIESSHGILRPAGEEYFKKISLNLDNGKQIGICAEDTMFDGYCDIYITK